MKVKDIVKITILSVVGFVLSMIGALAAPLLGNYSFAGEVSFGALLSGTVYYILIQKVPKRGVAFCYYMINALVCVLTGFWPLCIVLLVSGAIAEICLIPVGSYKKSSRVILSFILSTVVYGLHGVVFFGMIGADRIVSAFPKMYTKESVAILSKYLVSPASIIILILALAVCALIGILLGKNIYNKFFAGKAKKQSQRLG